MILSNEQVIQLFGEKEYSCAFNQKRFSYLLFREQMSSHGDIITFQNKIKIGSLEFEKGLVFCMELPNTNMFGGVCFQRLFSTMLGSLLSELIEKNVSINEGCIFIDEKQSSINVINTIKTSAVIHLIFPQSTNSENFFVFDLDKNVSELFQTRAIEGFYQLSRSIFLQTQHDNF